MYFVVFFIGFEMSFIFIFWLILTSRLCSILWWLHVCLGQAVNLDNPWVVLGQSLYPCFEGAIHGLSLSSRCSSSLLLALLKHGCMLYLDNPWNCPNSHFWAWHTGTCIHIPYTVFRFNSTTNLYVFLIDCIYFSIDQFETESEELKNEILLLFLKTWIPVKVNA